MRVLCCAALALLLPACTEQVDCEREAAGLRSWLESVPRSSRLDPMIPVVPYDGPADTLTAADEQGTQFVVDQGGVSSMGESLWRAESTREELALAVRERIEVDRDRRARATESEDVQLPAVAITIAPDAPWSIVAATLEGVALIAGIGGARLALVFEKTGAAARGRPPGPSKVDAELAAIAPTEDAWEKRKRLGEVYDRIVEKCKPAEHLLAETDVSSAREVYLREELPRRVAACGCKCDMAALRSFLWTLLAAHKPAAVVKIVVTAAVGEAKTVVTLPADTPWSAAHGKLLEARAAGSIAVAVR